MAEIKSGIIDISPLYFFTENEGKYLFGENKEESFLKGDSSEGKKYSKKVKDICAALPDEQGVYIWGCFEANCSWKNIYIGKSGKGKTSSVRARIEEELKDERVFLCVKGNNGNALKMIGSKLYPKMWNQYEAHWDRAIQKANSTYIVWVALPKTNEKDISDIEAELIETMNPSANKNRPAPSSNVNKIVYDVILAMRKCIHETRKN